MGSIFAEKALYGSDAVTTNPARSGRALGSAFRGMRTASCDFICGGVHSSVGQDRSGNKGSPQPACSARSLVPPQAIPSHCMNPSAAYECVGWDIGSTSLPRQDWGGRATPMRVRRPVRSSWAGRTECGQPAGAHAMDYGTVRSPCATSWATVAVTPCREAKAYGVPCPPVGSTYSVVLPPDVDAVM